MFCSCTQVAFERYTVAAVAAGQWSYEAALAHKDVVFQVLLTETWSFSTLLLVSIHRSPLAQQRMIADIGWV